MAAAPRHEAGRAADRPRHGGADGRAESARDRAARSDPGVAGHATAEPGAAAPLPTGAGRRDEAACRPARPVSGPAKRQRAGRADAPGWTVAAVERRVVEAVDTLKRVPVPDIQRNVTRWPGFIRVARRADVHGRRRHTMGGDTGPAPDRPAGSHLMGEVPAPWLLALGVPAFGGLWLFVVHSRKAVADLRVELAEYKAHVAERYVPYAAQAAFEREVMRRLERIEDLLHRQLSPPPD